jgi:hypothetical protein
MWLHWAECAAEIDGLEGRMSDGMGALMGYIAGDSRFHVCVYSRVRPS